MSGRYAIVAMRVTYHCGWEKLKTEQGNSSRVPDADTLRTIVFHSVLAGLTPLIPIPFADDLVKTYVQRRCIRQISGTYGVQLTKPDLKTLADDPDSGFFRGAVLEVVLYPAKKIFRKAFFVLEIKRAVDTVSLTFHRGLLTHHAFQAGWIGKHPAPAIRNALDAACREVGVKPVERVFFSVLRQSRDLVASAADLLYQSLKSLVTSRKPDESAIAAAVEAVEKDEESLLSGIVDRLLIALTAIPSSHFDRLKEVMAVRLTSP